MKWWDDLSIGQKWTYTGTAAVLGGAIVGTVRKGRPIRGAFIGFGLWGVGMTVYTLWQAQRVVRKVPGFGEIQPPSS